MTTDDTATMLPPLPFEEWEETKATLHRFLQVVGKVRLASVPRANHWWHVPLYVTTKGLTTGPMPYGDLTFAVDFDFIDHRLVISTSSGARESFALTGLSVARFYERFFEVLSRFGIEVEILAEPFDLTPAVPFAADTAHAAYDEEYVSRYFRVLAWVDMTFKEFAGRFAGKTSPVHLFWHSMDIAVTRFSGRRAPLPADADLLTREGYSHELISFGFWPGDYSSPAPAFYSYTSPEPAGLTHHLLAPDEASWVDFGGSSRAILAYEDLRRKSSPRTALLDYLESAYRAGATAAGWDTNALAADPAGAGG